MRSRRLARKRGGSRAARRGLQAASKSGLSSLGGPGSRMTILRRPLTVRVEELAGGAAVGVVEDLGAFEHVGLLGVVGRHDDAAGGEALVEAGEEIGVAMEREAEGGGDGLAGEVVLGGAEAAGEEDDVGAVEGGAGGVGEVLEVVADDGFEGDGDAEVVETGGEVERVGVLPVGGEHLGAGGDDFSDHKLSVPVGQSGWCGGAVGWLAVVAVRVGRCGRLSS